MSEERIEIVVPVAGRSYPLTVSPEEVDGIMAAAQAIDESIAKLKSQFAVQDRNDLLAMTALQLSIKLRALEDGGAGASGNAGGAGAAGTAGGAEKSEDTTQLESNIDNLLQRLESVMQG